MGLTISLKRVLYRTIRKKEERFPKFNPRDSKKRMFGGNFPGNVYWMFVVIELV